MTPPPLVKIVWEDACCLDPDERWVDHKEARYVPLQVTSIGFLLHQSKAGVIITAAWSPDCTGPRDQIPAGMIRKITRLRS
jgi:hypothetical protein